MLHEHIYRQYLPGDNADSRFSTVEEILANPFLKPIEEGCGLPVFYDGSTAYVDTSDVHSLVVIPTGGKKSRSFSRPIIQAAVNAGESLVVTDPKGELTGTFYKTLIDSGYEVDVINFKNPDSSTVGFNPLRLAFEAYKCGDSSKAERLIASFSNSLFQRVTDASDPFWSNTGSAFFSSVLSLMVSSSPDLAYANIRNAIALCSRGQKERLKILESHIEDSGVSGIATGFKSVLDINASQTVDGLYTTISGALSALANNESLLNLLSEPGIDLSTFGINKKTALFIVPPEDEGYQFLVSFFTEAVYRSLCENADSCPQCRLPVRCNFVLDEFANTPRWNAITALTISRSKNIRFFLFVQSVSQLSEKYGSTAAATIVSNCGNLVVGATREASTTEMVLAIAGTRTDYRGNRTPLISLADIQTLQKETSMVQVIYFREHLLPYVGWAPDFYYTSYADKLEETDCFKLSVTTRDKGKFLPAEKLIRYIIKEENGFIFYYAHITEKLYKKDNEDEGEYGNDGPPGAYELRQTIDLKKGQSISTFGGRKLRFEGIDDNHRYVFLDNDDVKHRYTLEQLMKLLFLSISI